MILTISLNPSIEKSISIPSWSFGGSSQATPLCSEAAGKGLLVSMAIKHLGGEPFCIGLNYSVNGRLITSSLEQVGILYDLVTVPGELRTKLNIREELTGRCTQLNEPGEFVPPEFLKDLRFRISRAAERCSVAALCGSAPKGVPDDLYASLVTELQANGVKVVLDAKQGLLEKGIAACPWMIKPNLEEMESLFGTVYQQEEQVIADAKKIISRGVTMVCVSMGALGALLISKENVWKAHPAQGLNVKHTRGAGVGMVAGICLAAEQGGDPEKMLRYATAAACATITQEKNQMCNRLDFEQMLTAIKIKKCENT